MSNPTSNLETFKILYLIKGILAMVSSLFFVAYAAFGGIMFSEVANKQSDVPFNPALIFIFIGGIGAVLAIAFGVLNIMVSRAFKNRNKYTFIFVMGILNCLSGVLGILLGVFTLVELNKPEVKEAFGQPV